MGVNAGLTVLKQAKDEQRIQSKIGFINACKIKCKAGQHVSPMKQAGMYANLSLP